MHTTPMHSHDISHGIAHSFERDTIIAPTNHPPYTKLKKTKKTAPLPPPADYNKDTSTGTTAYIHYFIKGF